MGIYGYKSFSPDGKNINGALFVPGVVYTVPGKAHFGTNGNGYHFALRLEDTLLFRENPDERTSDYVIAYVYGDGDIAEGESGQGTFEDLYVATRLTVIKYLSRKEIIQYALSLPPYRMLRFVSYFRLKSDEIALFIGKDENVDCAINYYQLGVEDAYTRRYTRPYKSKRPH